MRNAWSNDFYRVYEDFEYGVIDVDQFKAKLVALGFPQGYIDWLVYMSARET